jgi:hypothetical protein
MSAAGTINVFYLIASAALGVVAIPLVLRLIKPNSWYGFRTPHMQTNPELWYTTNVTAGSGCLLTAVITLVVILAASLVNAASAEIMAFLLTLILPGGILLTLFYTWRKYRA